MSGHFKRKDRLFTSTQSGSSGNTYYGFASNKFSGQFYDVFLATGVATGSAGYWNGVLSAIPFVVGDDHTVTDIQFEVTTAAVASTARIAIYTSTSAGYPDALIEESGDISTATTGLKTYTFATPINLDASNRLYFIVFQCSSASLIFREPTGMIYLLPSSGANKGANYRYTFGYAAMPATFPGGASINTGGFMVKLKKQ